MDMEDEYDPDSGSYWSSISMAGSYSSSISMLGSSSSSINIFVALMAPELPLSAVESRAPKLQMPTIPLPSTSGIFTYTAYTRLGHDGKVW